MIDGSEAICRCQQKGPALTAWALAAALAQGPSSVRCARGPAMSGHTTQASLVSATHSGCPSLSTSCCGYAGKV